MDAAALITSARARLGRFARAAQGPLAARNVSARVGLALVGLLVTFAILGPLVSPNDPYTSDFTRGVTPEHLPVGPSREFWLGTDRLFRDVFARLATGARLSLLIGVAATALATAVGSVVGVLAGWYEGRWLDTLLMRLVDVGLAFPFLLIVMALGAAPSGRPPRRSSSRSASPAGSASRGSSARRRSRCAASTTSSRRARSGSRRRACSSATSCPTLPGRSS